MTRVVEPMIDLHQAPHNTNIWEKGPTRLRDSTVRVDPVHCSRSDQPRGGPPSPRKPIFTAFRWWMAAGEAMCGSCSINDWRSLGVDVQTVKKVLASWGSGRYDAEARPFAPTGSRGERSFRVSPHSRLLAMRRGAIYSRVGNYTGLMRGRVLNGKHQGAALDDLDVKTLIGLVGEMDEDSRRLLTAYLDRREPHWREHAADTQENRRHTRRNGKMTNEEAYQILETFKIRHRPARLGRGFMRSGESAAVVRQGEIDQRSDRHDAGRIDVAMAAIIVAFDVIEADSVSESRHLIEIAQIVSKIWIVDDAPQIAFEVTVVNGVEADQRGEKPPVRLSDRRAN
jgi:hypothetical protein